MRIADSSKLILAVLFGALLYAVPAPLHAYIIGTDLEFLQDVTDGTTSLAMFVVSEMFIPPTHFTPGDMTVSVSPSYFRAERLWKSSNSIVDAEDLQGGGMGFAATYAITDRMGVYVNFATVYMKGSVRGDHEGDDTPHDETYEYTMGHPYRMTGECANDSVLVGFGYDLFRPGRWSLPVFVGFHYYRNFTRMEFEPLPGNTIDPHMRIWTRGSQTGVDFAIAIARKIGSNKKITLFVLSQTGSDEHGPSTEAVITRNSPYDSYQMAGMRETVPGSGVASQYVIPGFAISYMIPDFPVSIDLNVMGLVSNASNFYNDLIFHELAVSHATLTVTYHGIHPFPAARGGNAQAYE